MPTLKRPDPNDANPYIIFCEQTPFNHSGWRFRILTSFSTKQQMEEALQKAFLDSHLHAALHQPRPVLPVNIPFDHFGRTHVNTGWLLFSTLQIGIRELEMDITLHLTHQCPELKWVLSSSLSQV